MVLFSVKLISCIFTLNIMMSLKQAMDIFESSGMFKTGAEVNSAFRRLSLHRHPDRGMGGTAAAFVQLQEAKDVLLAALNEPPAKKFRSQAQVRGKMHGSVGRWSVCGQYIKSSNNSTVTIKYEDGRWLVDDSALPSYPIKVDATNGTLEYYDHIGKVTYEKIAHGEFDNFIDWSNGNRWILIKRAGS